MIPERPTLLGKFILLFALLFLIPSRAAEPTNGLVAYYPFNGNANDASGHNLNGQAVDATGTTDRSGNADGALLFNGATSFVDCGDRPEWKFDSSFSIVAWVKLDGDQSEKYIVSKYDFGNATNAYGLGTAANSVLYGFLKGDVATYQDAWGGPSLNDAQWHVLTMVYTDSVGFGLYVDGGLVASRNTGSYPPFADNTPLQIGRTVTGQFFGGSIDDVRIYNRALSSTEIAEMGPPPSITVTRQPLSGYSIVGNTVTLRSAATASGNVPVSYQWLKNGEPILNATSPIIRVTRDTVGSDSYEVRFTAGATVAFSSEATVEFGPTAPSALLAHYSFETGGNGLIVDETGNYRGDGFNTEFVPGRVGARALHFNGTNAFVRIPFPASPLDLAGTPYTIAFWMKPEQRASQMIVWMGETTDTHGGYGFFLNSFSATWKHATDSDPNIYDLLQIPFGSATNWVHFAMVFNGAQRTLYLNGAVTNRVATTNSIVSDRDDNLYFGSNNGTNSFFRGSLDDIRIYNYALASDEILQLSSAVPTTSLLVSQLGSSLAFKWPYDPSTDYRLEFTTELGPTAQWTPASGIPQRSGEFYTLSQPFDSAMKFFRLHKL